MCSFRTTRRLTSARIINVYAMLCRIATDSLSKRLRIGSRKRISINDKMKGSFLASHSLRMSIQKATFCVAKSYGLHRPPIIYIFIISALQLSGYPLALCQNMTQFIYNMISGFSSAACCAAFLWLTPLRHQSERAFRHSPTPLSSRALSCLRVSCPLSLAQVAIRRLRQARR